MKPTIKAEFESVVVATIYLPKGLELHRPIGNENLLRVGNYGGLTPYINKKAIVDVIAEKLSNYVDKSVDPDCVLVKKGIRLIPSVDRDRPFGDYWSFSVIKQEEVEIGSYEHGVRILKTIFNK